MLSTAARRHGIDLGYKSAYHNHPMTLWVGNNLDNYVWTVEHGRAMDIEYTARGGKVHKSEESIKELDVYWGEPTQINKPPQSRADELKKEDFVKA